MSFVDTYTALWIGICLGMSLISLFYALVGKYITPKWFGIYALIFFAAAFGVRWFIHSLIVA